MFPEFFETYFRNIDNVQLLFGQCCKNTLSHNYRSSSKPYHHYDRCLSKHWEERKEKRASFTEEKGDQVKDKIDGSDVGTGPIIDPNSSA